MYASNKDQDYCPSNYYRMAKLIKHTVTKEFGGFNNKHLSRNTK